MAGRQKYSTQHTAKAQLRFADGELEALRNSSDGRGQVHESVLVLPREYLFHWFNYRHEDGVPVQELS